MEEKVLCKGKACNFVYVVIAAWVLGAACFCAIVLPMIDRMYSFYGDNLRYHIFGKAAEIGISSSAILVICLAVTVFYLLIGKTEIVVTDKRTYGKVAFGKRVDLPNDSISAISMVPMLKGVAVATSSGKISFLLIRNADEVYDAVNKLLMARQEKKAEPVVVATPAVSNAGELKQYKELLDSGAISQEEYDAKKKQLLGL